MRLDPIYYLKRLYHFIDMRAVLPLLKWSAGLIRRWIDARRTPDATEAVWKERALDDFRDWLADLPDELPEDKNVSMDSCDLYTLLTEFTSLRQEIKLQTREQNRALRHHEALIDGYQEAAALFKERVSALAELEESIRLAAEKKALAPFLDVRDALARGLASARAVSRIRSFFRRPPHGMEGVVEGYEMALRRFDRALSHAGVAPLITVGRPFDAAAMRAVERRSDPGREPGVVIEEFLGGFIRGDEVIRTAEVAVSKGK